MRLQELFSQPLNEIKMSPANLKNLAAQTGAIAGMEFEMIARGYAVESKYDLDGSVYNFSDIEEIFGESNSSRAINRVINHLENRYYLWARKQAQDDWETPTGHQWFIQWLKDNVTPAEVAIEMELPSEDAASYEDFAQWTIDNDLGWSRDAFDEFADEQQYDQRDFLVEEGLNTFNDVYSEYSHIIDLPDNQNLDESYSNLSKDLEQLLKKEVDWATQYHYGDRTANAYVIEPDSSIDVRDESSDVAAEIVSPPMPVDQMITDYKKIRAWSLMHNHYTNSSTGLHINVSIPGFNLDQLDYLKLVLLSGDEHVLKQFGRLSSGYARNSLGVIKKELELDQNIDRLLGKLSQNFEKPVKQFAAVLMHRNHLSVSVKSNRIEFRSPGGDWLAKDPEEIENTVYRYVVALDAAMHPEKFRAEYLKKLYQLLDVNDAQTIGLAKFHGKMIPKEEFIKLLKNAYKPRMTAGAAPAASPVQQ
jgi:hypothetical protein